MRRSLLIILLLAFSASVTAFAQDAPSAEDDAIQNLLESANQSRADNATPALRIDPALASAAQRHADAMAAARDLSHQLNGEPDLLARASQAGAHFSALAENIAVSDALHRIHESWMKSPAHRENLMNPAYNVIGIGIAQRGREIYAVEDFATLVSVRPLRDIEQRVRDMLAVRGLTPLVSTTVESAAARNACAAGGKYNFDAPEGPAPRLVIYFASPDLESLGPILDKKLANLQGHSAAAGACEDTDGRGYTRYKMDVLVY